MMWHTQINSLDIPDHFYQWLHQPFKLHPAYERLSHDIKVELMRQTIIPVFAEEATRLQLNIDEPIYAREIFIRCDNQRISFARTAIPMETYLANKSDFDTLGSQLIGKALLYDRDYVERGPFEYGILNKDNPFYQLINDYLDTALTELIYARRSLFRIHDLPLLITEIFLPTIPVYIGA